VNAGPFLRVNVSYTQRAAVVAAFIPVFGVQMNWMKKAACRGLNTDLFFPGSIDGNRSCDIHPLAQLTCSGCSVRSECLGYALSIRTTEGNWAGTTFDDRRVLSKLNWCESFGRTACECRFCVAANWLIDSPSLTPRYADTNARHGFSSTYRKDCRCGPCKVASGLRTARYTRSKRCKQYVGSIAKAAADVAAKAQPCSHHRVRCLPCKVAA